MLQVSKAMKRTHLGEGIFFEGCNFPPFDNVLLELPSHSFFREDAVVKINSCYPEYVAVL